MYVQVLHLPRGERKTKGMPFGNMGVRVLGYPKSREKIANGNGKKGIEQIEMDYITLREGINQIPSVEWEAAIAHSPNNIEIKRLISQSVISVFSPSEGKLGRCTADFSDFQDVFEIVNNCNDKEWLLFSLQTDTRISEQDGGDVQQLIRERLQVLEEMAGNPQTNRLSIR